MIITYVVLSSNLCNLIDASQRVIHKFVIFEKKRDNQSVLNWPNTRKDLNFGTSETTPPNVTRLLVCATQHDSSQLSAIVDCP